MQLIKRIIKKIRHNVVLQFIYNNSVYGLLRLFFATYRLDICYKQHPNANTVITQPGVFYFWHQHIISGMFFFFKTQPTFSCVVSPSFDGKIIGFSCKKLGLNVIYGSPYKNPIGLTRQALEVLNKSGRLCLVGDGSRGPALHLQKGIKYLARKSSVPLIYIECKPSHTITLTKTWDQFKIPLPFSKIRIIVHQPISPQTDI